MYLPGCCKQPELQACPVAEESVGKGRRRGRRGVRGEVVGHCGDCTSHAGCCSRTHHRARPVAGVGRSKEESGRNGTLSNHTPYATCYTLQLLIEGVQQGNGSALFRLQLHRLLQPLLVAPNPRSVHHSCRHPLHPLPHLPATPSFVSLPPLLSWPPPRPP